MNLKNQVEWALHCVSVLASLPEDRYLAAQTLAEYHGVPKEYLSKALQALAKAGLVEGRLGPKGGYRLARPPKDITFLHVVEAVEGSHRSFTCTEIRKNSPCANAKDKSAYAPVCAIAKVMYQADRAYRRVLAETTFAQLQGQLSRELSTDAVNRSLTWLLGRAG